MKRTASLTIALCLSTSLALAETVQDSIVRQLQDQGFSRIEIQRTLLGRVRIEAYSNTLERELVFNPSTGEILRDYWEPRDDDDDDGGPRLRDPNDDDFDDEDDDKEDFEDDDEDFDDEDFEDEDDEDDDHDDEDEDEDDEDDDDDDEDDEDE